ncbi:hypothetical protein FG386_002999 [Cryptosporidium ryanae]|uniref:uncharacterized protein n=1 Tax=Cryptosporidium ryanae TaxID=515981 RepID=UPI00351AA3A0|nr:hypothetical protein FG386_002999 [Cryptosporidium ryanae]
MEEIVTLLSLSASTNPNDVKVAENSLNMKESLPGFVETILTIVSKTELETHIRQVGCIYMKNLVKRKWDLDWEQGGMSKSDRDIIKGNIVNIYMNSPVIIQSQIGEMLLYISVRDFPSYWNTLLSDIVKFLPDDSVDMIGSARNGVFTNGDIGLLVSKLRQYECTLSIIKLILDKYRYAESSNKILLELKEILKIVCEPMYKMFVYSSHCLVRQLPVITQDSNSRLFILKICLLSCQIFYILHCCDIPEFFEDRIAIFMESFHAILELDAVPCILGDEEHLINYFSLKGQICENLRIYSDRYQEPFDIYSRKSLSTVAILLTKMVSQDKKNLENSSQELLNSMSTLVDEGLRFIGSLAATQWSENSFLDAGVLDHLVEKILIPCTFLDLNDLSLIEEMPKDFIYKYIWDINDVCDSTSKRSAALECIKNLGKFYFARLNELLSTLIINLLNKITNDNSTFYEWEEYNEKSNQYCKYKISNSDVTREASVFLFICLSVRSFSRTSGVTQLEHNIDLVGFYERYIRDFTDTPLMRCCALKYLIVFRSHFSDKASMDILNQSYNWLLNRTSSIEEMMILMAFEKILTQKVSNNALNNIGNGNSVNGNINNNNNNNTCVLFKLNPNDTQHFCLQILNDYLHPMLKRACIGNEKRSYLTESEFIPRCIVKLLIYLNHLGSEYVNGITPTIVDCIKLAIENPKNPSFNHYLFELLGVCIRNSSNCEDLDQFILPLLIGILEKNLTDFIPYSLQLLALRLDTKPSQNDLYDKLFVHLIDAKIWHGPISIIPGITRLCTSFFRQYTFQNTILGNLKQVFERFQFCLGHRRLQSNVSFDFLRDIVRYLPFQWYSQYLTALCNILLTKSQEWNRIGDTIMIVQVIGSLSIVVIKKPFNEFNEHNLMNTLDTLQSGLSVLFFEKVVFPNLQKATLSPQARYVIFIALLKLMYETQVEQATKLSNGSFIFEAFKTIYCIYNSINSGSLDEFNLQRKDTSSNSSSLIGGSHNNSNQITDLSNSILDQNGFVQDEYEINYHKLLVASGNTLTCSYPAYKEIFDIINFKGIAVDDFKNGSYGDNRGNSPQLFNFLKCIYHNDYIKLIKFAFQPYLAEIGQHYTGNQNIQSFVSILSNN